MASVRLAKAIEPASTSASAETRAGRRGQSESVRVGLNVREREGGDVRAGEGEQPSPDVSRAQWRRRANAALSSPK